ncbi:MAG: hypothetical protein ACE5JU_18845 [Candidatus Binatia bacterium]
MGRCIEVTATQPAERLRTGNAERLRTGDDEQLPPGAVPSPGRFTKRGWRKNPVSEPRYNRVLSDPTRISVAHRARIPYGIGIKHDLDG